MCVVVSSGPCSGVPKGGLRRWPSPSYMTISDDGNLIYRFKMGYRGIYTFKQAYCYNLFLYILPNLTVALLQYKYLTKF